MFSQNKSLLIFPEKKGCTFQLQVQKIKNPPQEKSLILQEMETPKNLLCFLKRKILYIYKIFLETETPKRNSKKGSFISGGNLQRPKKKVCFEEICLL